MKEVKIWKLERISNNPELANWYNAHLLITCSVGKIMVKSSNYHKSFWMKEFDLSEDEFNKIEVIGPFEYYQFSWI